MLPFAELLHGTFGHIGTIICDDTVWKAKPKNHLFDELNRRGRITLANRFCLHPLCKLVNRHQEVGLLIFGPFESPTISSPQVANGQVMGIMRNS